MKKSSDQKEQPRRLTLSRETIQVLEQRLLSEVRGGAMVTTGITTSTYYEESGAC